MITPQQARDAQHDLQEAFINAQLAYSETGPNAEICCTNVEHHLRMAVDKLGFRMVAHEPESMGR